MKCFALLRFSFATAVTVVFGISGHAFAEGEAASAVPPAGEPVERLADFTVIAGRMPTGAAPGAILNTVEVLSTPGSTADINRALQTFPGVQQVDEGNALFVRGGDSIETATLVNGIRYPAATRLNAPTGSFSGTLDPMQTRSITFLNGGLSAQYGNVLSGVVDLATRSAPTSSSATINLGLGALGATGNVAVGHGIGFRATAVRSSVAPIVGINGTKHDYEEKPRGHDLSLAAGWSYRPGGEVRSYGLDQENDLSLRIDSPELKGLYKASVHSTLATLSWSDQFGDWKWNGNAGSDSLSRDERTPLGDVSTRNAQKQFNLSVTRDLSGIVAFSGGVEWTGSQFSLEKSRTDNGVFQWFRRDIDGDRTGAFLQADAVVTRHVRAIVGGRMDHSELTDETTADPRVSLAWEPARDLSLSVAGGTYHQIPDGYYFFAADGGRMKRTAMRAQDAFVAAEYRRDTQVFRVEAYQKQYGALAQMSRDHTPVAAAGFGEARGLDLFWKTTLPGDFTGRLTWSYVNADRTDPNTGRMESAPWDITHSVSVVVEKTLGGWHASAGWRYGAGRPVTPISGAVPALGGGWQPIYGEAYSERVRPLQRLDLLVYRVWFVNPSFGVTTYLSMHNVFNRANVYNYSYSDDFSRRWNSPSLFNRVIYFGAMFNFY
ncbi:MAG: TonB-dependent receptor plug domain-containing protein [Nibricoccus sp.]